MPNPMMNAMGAGGPASSPTTAIGMFNPGGHQMPAQAIANAQGKPFQPGGMFNPQQPPPINILPINPMQQALTQPAAPVAPQAPQMPQVPQMPNGFPSQAMAPNAMPQGFMQHAAPQMNPQTLAFLQSLFARR